MTEEDFRGRHGMSAFVLFYRKDHLNASKINQKTALDGFVNRNCGGKMNIDKLLKEVLTEAETLHIPHSERINRHVIINERAKSRFGCCRRIGAEYVIEIAATVLLCEDKVIKQILAHEILHTCDGCYNHSPLWKLYAIKMNQEYGYNIQRTCSGEELGIPEEYISKRERQVNFRLKCTACGAVFERQRNSKLVSSPHLYRCKCGGTLKRLDENLE